MLPNYKHQEIENLRTLGFNSIDISRQLNLTTEQVTYLMKPAKTYKEINSHLTRQDIQRLIDHDQKTEASKNSKIKKLQIMYLKYKGLKASEIRTVLRMKQSSYQYYSYHAVDTQDHLEDLLSLLGGFNRIEAILRTPSPERLQYLGQINPQILSLTDTVLIFKTVRSHMKT